jgi:uncharacterized protein YbcV (DUF1398 family)
MENKELNVYLNERMKELLNKAQAFEKRVISDRESFMKSMSAVKKAKEDNKDTNYKDHKDDLINMQKTHYNSFLLEQNLQHVLNTIIEVSNMANILKVELDLPEEEKKALETITKTSTNIFTLDKAGEVVLADSEMRPMIEQAMNEKITDDTQLKVVFDNMA